MEFILVAPLMLLLVFGMIDFGFAIDRNTLISNAAREGAREGAFNPVGSDIEAKVMSALGDLDAADITVNLTCEAPGGGSCALDGDTEPGSVVKVDVEYLHHFVTFAPSTVGLGGSTTISGFAEMRVE